MRRSTLHIRTNVADLTEREWEQIRAAAAILLRTCPPDCVPCGQIILPGRPEILLLREEDDGFVLDEVGRD